VKKLLTAESYYTVGAPRVPSPDTSPPDSRSLSEQAKRTTEEDEGSGHKEVIQLRYDKLVICVGAQSNTFGVPGVERYCFFLKQLSDARMIRNRILECFEVLHYFGLRQLYPSYFQFYAI
jgi:hypothetical protein